MPDPSVGLLRTSFQPDSDLWKSKECEYGIDVVLDNKISLSSFHFVLTLLFLQCKSPLPFADRIMESTPSSDEAVSNTMQKGLERILIHTGTGILIGGLAGVVLSRGGASGARKVFAGLGGGIGLGSAWTRTSMDLEELLQGSSSK